MLEFPRPGQSRPGIPVCCIGSGVAEEKSHSSPLNSGGNVGLTLMVSLLAISGSGMREAIKSVWWRESHGLWLGFNLSTVDKRRETKGIKGASNDAQNLSMF